MPNPIYIYIYIYTYIYDSVSLGFMAYQPFQCYLMPNPLYTYILNVFDMVCLSSMAW